MDLSNKRDKLSIIYIYTHMKRQQQMKQGAGENRYFSLLSLKKQVIMILRTGNCTKRSMDIQPHTLQAFTETCKITLIIFTV
jgi:hypothetical protein